MTTDADLIGASRTDAGAFRQLYDRYAERVYRFHLCRSRDADAAHDLAAETFAQAWLSRTAFRDEADGSAGPWLFAIARHVLSASVRRGRLEQTACTRLGVRERREREPATAEPDETWLEGLDEALAELPGSQLDALRLATCTTSPARSSPTRSTPLRRPPACASTAGSRRSDSVSTRRRRAPDDRIHDVPRPPRRRARERGRGGSVVRPRRDFSSASPDLDPHRDRGRRRGRPRPGGRSRREPVIGTDAVEQSRPAGTLALAGTNPTCTVVAEGVEYLCTLERAPAPEVSDWKGTVEPTVDATKHVNGGCRSLTSDGREWRCYLGQAAVDQQIIGPDFLGEYAPSPGVG